MAEEMTKTGGSNLDASRCPWCSAELTSADDTHCPSCGAVVREDPAAEAPGVTRIDHEAVLRARSAVPKGRGLMGWLSGEVPESMAPVDPDTIAPPPPDVRAEIRRMEYEALLAEVAAEASAAADPEATADPEPPAPDPDAVG